MIQSDWFSFHWTQPGWLPAVPGTLPHAGEAKISVPASEAQKRAMIIVLQLWPESESSDEFIPYPLYHLWSSGTQVNGLFLSSFPTLNSWTSRRPRTMPMAWKAEINRGHGNRLENFLNRERPAPRNSSLVVWGRAQKSAFLTTICSDSVPGELQTTHEETLIEGMYFMWETARRASMALGFGMLLQS